MQRISSILIVTMLASCAISGREMQAECETKFRGFPEIFQCTYDNVASRNPSILQDARAKLYLLRGEQLAVEVLEKKTSNISAKVAWQQLYVELKAAKDREMAAAFDSISRSLEAARLQNIQQTQVNRTVNCTSNRIGSSTYTTCQ